MTVFFLILLFPSIAWLQNLNKSKEQLNSTEERLKQAMVDLQKLQMDLMAKKGECSGLEEQVGEGIRGVNGKISWGSYGAVTD